MEPAPRCVTCQRFGISGMPGPMSPLLKTTTLGRKPLADERLHLYAGKAYGTVAAAEMIGSSVRDCGYNLSVIATAGHAIPGGRRAEGLLFRSGEFRA